jgi:hypothetical protein
MVRFGTDQRTKSVYRRSRSSNSRRSNAGSAGDVRLLLGPPGQTMSFSRMNEEVWSYRYQASAGDNPHLQRPFRRDHGLRAHDERPDGPAA